jgi:hypothetical protein
MHTLRRLFAKVSPAPTGRWRNAKVVALLLVIVVPGGIALPIFYGIYGAIRHTFAPKTHSRSASAPLEGVDAVTAPLEPEPRPEPLLP